MLRINPDNNCIIQKLDCDGAWQPWLDITKCVQSTTFDLQINLGGINFGSGQPATNECHDYDLIHESTGITLIPVTMSTGDIITFSDWKGAATDGFSVDNIADITLLPVWYCPSGKNFALNECHDEPLPPHSDDPNQDLAHMRAMFVINNVVYDAFNTVITIPVGVANQQGYVVLNDHNLGDNSGVEQFHANICKLDATVGWTKIFDFTLSDGGFVADNRDGFGGIWTVGKGWGADVIGGHTSVVDIKLTLASAAHIKFIHHFWHFEKIKPYTEISNGADVYIPVPSGTSLITNLSPDTNRNASAIIDRTNTLIQVAALVYEQDAYTATQQAWITKLILQGDGTEPTWP